MVSTEQFLTLEFFGIIPSKEIHNIVRASSKPYSGAFTFLQKKKK